jgi:hypothetical protein
VIGAVLINGAKHVKAAILILEQLAIVAVDRTALIIQLSFGVVDDHRCTQHEQNCKKHVSTAQAKVIGLVDSCLLCPANPQLR